jgi:hypothetical protein
MSQEMQFQLTNSKQGVMLSCVLKRLFTFHVFMMLIKLIDWMEAFHILKRSFTQGNK